MKKEFRVTKIVLIGILLIIATVLFIVKIRSGNAVGRGNALPYDYDAAVDELKRYCGGFPTSFDSVENKVFLNDVTGDGVEDLCTFIFFGSGMPRMDIVMYDVENESFYTLDGWDFRGAYGYNYRILSVEEYGVVISEKQFYPDEHEVKFGLLLFEEGKLGMDEFEKGSSEYEHAKELSEELQSDGMIIF